MVIRKKVLRRTCGCISINWPVENLIFKMFLPPPNPNARAFFVEISENVADFLKGITGTLDIIYHQKTRIYRFRACFR